MTIGQPLEKLRKDLELLPNETLIKYRSDPTANAAGFPVGLLAATVLAHRAALQSQAAQQAAANTPPTVVDGIIQTLDSAAEPAAPAVPGQRPAVPGQPSVAPGGIAGVPQPAQQAPQPAPQAPQPAPQAPQPASQAPQPAPGFSSGGAVAFAEGGMSQTPDAYMTSPAEGFEDIEDDPSLPLNERTRRTLARLRRDNARRSDDSGLSLAQRWNKPEGPPVSDVYPETVGKRYPTYKADPSVGLPSGPSGGNAGAQNTTSELERSLIASGVTDPQERRNIIARLKGSDPYTYRVPGAPGQSAASEPPSGIAGLQTLNPRAEDVYKATDALAKFYAEPNTPMTEEERERRFQAAFDRRQKMLDPQFSKMQELIGKESMAASQSNAGNMGLMDLGLRLMSNRGGPLGQVFGIAGQGALGTFAEEKKRESAAQSAARKLEMGLLSDQMRASGQNFEGAEAAAVRAEALKRQEYTDRERALRGAADAAGTAFSASRNVEGDALRQSTAQQVEYWRGEKARAEAQRDEGKARIAQTQLELAQARLELLQLRAGQQARPSPTEMLAVQKHATDTWPQVQSRYLSAEVVNALRTPALAKQPAVMAAVEAGRTRYLQDLLSQSSKPLAPTSYDAASADLSGGR